jgi:predicted NAD/FAD-dependent oxidoreductase
MPLSDSSREPTILIVGAGMTGLSVAAALPEYGHRVMLVDKGRSVGGRMATRRVGPGRADHGAQFFTVRTPEFAQRVEAWRQAGLVFEWSRGWSDGSLAGSGADGHPRYAARDGMNALAKHLAADVAASGAIVHTGVKVQAISRTDAGWWACSEDGRVYTGRILVLTCPVPQALAMLDEGSVQLDSADRASLEAITYAPSLGLLVRIEGGTALPEPGALQQPAADVMWIADNQRKGISPGSTVLTLHASPEFSALHFAADADTILVALRPAIEATLAPGATILEAQVKRWRYALPTVLHPSRFLRAQGLPPLYFGGDAFGGLHLEGAALSGQAIAAELRRIFADLAQPSVTVTQQAA